MPSTLTPNMNLTAPTVGQQPGPTWAENINNDLITIDAHDHSSNNGVPVTPAGLSINADLSFISNNAINLRSSRYLSQSLFTLASDNQSFYVSGVDAFYRDGNGNNIRLTQSGGIAGSPGSITGLVSPASVTYVPGTPAFVFQSDSNKAANLDAGSVTIRKLTASSPGITVAAPSALAANYTLTLPSAPPGSSAVLQMDSAGNVTANNNLPNIASNSVQIGISPGTPLTYEPLFGNIIINGGGIQPNSSGNAVLQSFGDDRTLVANSSGGQSLPLVVSAAPTTHGLMIVRGGIVSNTPTSTEGYSLFSHPVSGIYNIIFSTPFTDTPAITANITDNGVVGFVTLQNLNTSSFTAITEKFPGPSPQDANFTFIAIGQRG